MKALGAGAVIVGSSAGALACGTVLAGAGIPTRILEPGEAVGEPYRDIAHPPYHFDAFPPLLWGLPAGAALTEALAPLVLPPFKCHDPGLQVILPRHRLSLYADDARLDRELRRECGARAPGARAFLADLATLAGRFATGPAVPPPLVPRPGAPNRSRLRRDLLPWFPPVRGGLTPVEDLLAAHGVGEVFAEAVAVLTAFWFGQPPGFCPALALALLIERLRGGLYLPAGGAQALTDALVAGFFRAGGYLRAGAPVQALLTRFGRVSAVLTGAGEAVPCSAVLLAPGGTPPFRKASRPAEDGSVPPPVGPPAGAVLHLAVPDTVLPPLLGPCALAAPGGADGPLCLLTLSPVGDPVRTPRGERALTVLFLPGREEDGAALAGAAPERLLARLEPILPGVGRFVRFAAVLPAPPAAREEEAASARLWWVHAIREPLGPRKGCLLLPRAGLLGRGLLSELCWGRYVAAYLLAH
ncbi:MAG: hypothetical protein HYT86_07350 [candidate division NC10 bacterium]|nr:hypothetical protein [candidate division NC10 bacterium]